MGFRTPKIATFHKLIIWFSDRYPVNIQLLPIDESELQANAWLAGFVEGDGSFYLRYRSNISKSPAVSTNFKLVLAPIHGQTGGSIMPIITKIAAFLAFHFIQ
jgi:hypothetical protein